MTAKRAATQTRATFPANTDEMTALDLARAYAAVSVPTFPVRGKVPAHRGGRGFKDATLDPEIFGSTWRRATGVGVAPGLVKSGDDVLIALDLDGAEQVDTVTRWLSERGLDVFADTVTTRSGRTSGGIHVYLSIDAEVGEAFTSGNLAVGGVKFLARGSGGYVVAPGSEYPGGGRYVFGSNVRTVAPCPTDLAEMIATKVAKLSPIGDSVEITTTEGRG